ncbi:MAG: hypothetical protein ACREA4_03280 [Nitrososphaera sp.]
MSDYAILHGGMIFNTRMHPAIELCSKIEYYELHETVVASSLSRSFAPFEFTLPTPYVIQLDDRILVQYSGPERVDVESWNSDKFDGSATRRVKFNSGTGKYTGSFQDTKDIVGKMSSQ